MPVETAETDLRACFLKTGRKADCCGCEACASVCPVDAVAMCEDRDGFRYPVVDKDACIGCGRCEAVCSLPAERFHATDAQRGFGGSIKDAELLAESTSGGAFTAVATAFLKDGGAVFGVEASNVYKARHACARDVVGLAAFRGSKYVQSEIGDTYRKVRELLKGGDRVLFSGTPCQVAGLYGYLSKLADSPLLTTVEVICEGVPTPLFIEKQLAFFSKKWFRGQPIESVKYRYKRNSECANWVNFKVLSLAIADWDYQAASFEVKSGKRRVIDRWFNSFWSVWLQHLISRPSCAECPFARRERVADITLGDLWGVHLYCPDLYNNDKGASLVVCNTKKGLTALEAAMSTFKCHELDMNDVVRYQGPMRKPTGMDPRRAECMADLHSLDYWAFTRKWAKKPTLKLLVSKYLWGTNKQVCTKANKASRKCGK